MKPTHIEHIGIAVSDLDEAVALYEKLLGQKCYNIEYVPEQKVRIAFFRIGESKIELLQSTDSEGTIAKFIEKRGEGIHHIAFAVEGLKEELNEAEESGIVLIDAKPKRGAEGLDIAFLHPKSTGGSLIEFCEKPS